MFSFLTKIFCPSSIEKDKTIKLLQIDLEIAIYDFTEMSKRAQRFEDLLVNKNASCTQAQALFVTNHCVERYRERGNFQGSTEDLRKKIYKLLVRQLLVLEKLSDGTYELDKNIVCRVKDNTAVTCMRRRGSKQ